MSTNPEHSSHVANVDMANLKKKMQDSLQEMTNKILRWTSSVLSMTMPQNTQQRLQSAINQSATDFFSMSSKYNQIHRWPHIYRKRELHKKEKVNFKKEHFFFKKKYEI